MAENTKLVSVGQELCNIRREECLYQLISLSVLVRLNPHNTLVIGSFHACFVHAYCHFMSGTYGGAHGNSEHSVPVISVKSI